MTAAIANIVRKDDDDDDDDDEEEKNRKRRTGRTFFKNCSELNGKKSQR